MRPLEHRRARPAVATALVCAALSACGNSGTQPRTHAQAAPPKTTASSPPKTTARPKPKRPPLGSLPQTNLRPSTNTRTFNAEMAALWRGVTRDSLKAAMPAFFPVRAYLQVKAIADARGDYIDRLVHGFRLDIGAAHALLGASARSARLIGVTVPAAYAHWVPPGVCANRIGYWEVPNARVVYSEHGQTRSFGIASMISWRGVWYVVHFGAVLSSGVVDSPAAGAGTSAPSSTC